MTEINDGPVVSEDNTELNRELHLTYAQLSISLAQYEVGFAQRYLLEQPTRQLLVSNLNTAKSYLDNALQVIQMVLDTEPQ